MICLLIMIKVQISAIDEQFVLFFTKVGVVRGFGAPGHTSLTEIFTSLELETRRPEAVVVIIQDPRNPKI